MNADVQKTNRKAELLANTVEVEDAPMASMFGLAGRTIRLPREAQEEERKVVRLSRPKGRAGKSRRRR